MSATPRTAWLRTEGRFAIICASCPDRAVAEVRAQRAGLGLSHGTCDECLPVVYGADIAALVFAQRAESAMVDRPLSFFLSATGGIPEQNDRKTTEASMSSATCGQIRAAGAHVPPHRQDHDLFEEPDRLVVFVAPDGRRYIDSRDIAAVCGIMALKLDVGYRPRDWGMPRDFRWDGSRMWYAEECLPQLIEALFAAKEGEAGHRLSTWLADHLERQGHTTLDASTAGQPASLTAPDAGTKNTGSAAASTPSGQDARVEKKSWAQEWEERHQ